jgi:catechol 2,3-dioxygenase
LPSEESHAVSEILLSQLAYAELISPKPDETVKWMVDVLGLEETTRDGQSVYLRGWAEWLHSSLIVTEGAEPGMGAIGWRAYGPGDPELVAQRVEGEWVPERPGRGAAFAYRSPVSGHRNEVFWEVERYQAPPELAEPDFRNRPQRFTGRGAAARYIDHVTVATPSIADEIAFRKTLGHRHTAQISPEPGFTVFATMTCNGIRSSHDLGLVPDFSGARGRVNHIAYKVDQRVDVERAAEVFMGAGTPIEFGPGIHGIDEITYLYVREPGGVRIEINSGGWENHEPDWQATDWQPTQGGTTFWKNVAMPESMMESFPPVDAQRSQENEAGLGATGLFVEKG